MNNRKMYGVLCESENGVDAFNNPKGKQILMESVGDMLNLHEATERAKEFHSSGRFGKAIVVELVIKEILF